VEVQFDGAVNGDTVWWSSRWRCSLVEQYMEVQFGGALNGGTVWWSSKWRSSLMEQ
jgi:hypothetical protein